MVFSQPLNLDFYLSRAKVWRVVQRVKHNARVLQDGRLGKFPTTQEGKRTSRVRVVLGAI